MTKLTNISVGRLERTAKHKLDHSIKISIPIFQQDSFGALCYLFDSHDVLIPQMAILGGLLLYVHAIS